MGAPQLGSTNWISLSLLMSRSAPRTATSAISVQMCVSKGECCKVLWVLDRPEIHCVNFCLTFTKHWHANSVNSSLLYHSGWHKLFEGQGRKRLKRHQLYAVGHQRAEGHPRVHFIMFYLRHHRAESKREVCLWSKLMYMQKKTAVVATLFITSQSSQGDKHNIITNVLDDSLGIWTAAWLLDFRRALHSFLL